MQATLIVTNPNSDKNNNYSAFYITDKVLVINKLTDVLSLLVDGHLVIYCDIRDTKSCAIFSKSNIRTRTEVSYVTADVSVDPLDYFKVVKAICATATITGMQQVYDQNTRILTQSPLSKDIFIHGFAPHPLQVIICSTMELLYHAKAFKKDSSMNLPTLFSKVGLRYCEDIRKPDTIANPLIPPSLDRSLDSLINNDVDSMVEDVYKYSLPPDLVAKALDLASQFNHRAWYGITVDRVTGISFHCLIETSIQGYPLKELYVSTSPINLYEGAILKLSRRLRFHTQSVAGETFLTVPRLPDGNLVQVKTSVEKLNDYFAHVKAPLFNPTWSRFYYANEIWYVLSYKYNNQVFIYANTILEQVLESFATNLLINFGVLGADLLFPGPAELLNLAKSANFTTNTGFQDDLRSKSIDYFKLAIDIANSKNVVLPPIYPVRFGKDNTSFYKSSVMIDNINITAICAKKQDSRMACLMKIFFHILGKKDPVEIERIYGVSVRNDYLSLVKG